MIGLADLTGLDMSVWQWWCFEVKKTMPTVCWLKPRQAFTVQFHCICSCFRVTVDTWDLQSAWRAYVMSPSFKVHVFCALILLPYCQADFHQEVHDETGLLTSFTRKKFETNTSLISELSRRKRGSKQALPGSIPRKSLGAWNGFLLLVNFLLSHVAPLLKLGSMSFSLVLFCFVLLIRSQWKR